MLYIAYGSNLNKKEMNYRCPGAEVAFIGKVKDYELVFNYYADIRPKKGSEVPVAVWRINKSQEKLLDNYEGYPTLYRKEYIPVMKEDGTTETALVYVMNSKKQTPPSKDYIYRCAQGYKDCGLNVKFFIDRVNNAYKIFNDSLKKKAIK